MNFQNRWLGVEVRHLVALETVLSERSFAGAARRLGYTQSAISVQIALLERVAGTPLVVRPGGRQAISATAAGERLRDHARRLVQQIQAAESDLTALATGEGGVIRIAAFQTASMRLLPPALARLRSAHPRIEVLLDEAPYVEQLEHLASGAIDLAFVLLPVTGPFASIELARDPFLYATARDPSRSAHKLPSLTALARQPMISWQSSPVAIESVLRSRAMEPHVVVRSDECATVQNMVAEGLGAAVLPRLALELPDERLLVLDASRHMPPRAIGVAWHQDRKPSPAGQAMIDAIRAHTASYAEQHDSIPPPGVHPVK
jgi:DNA-binding transcriptional LysR family regulator